MTFQMFRPGRFAPAVLLALMAASALPAPLLGQAPPRAAPGQPVPNELELSKLVWSTLAAVDHANQAGNYSVLRDLSAPAFQMNNDAAALAQIFAPVRASGIDLSNALLLAPTYTAPPAMRPGGVMRVQGYFGLRPTAIGFDLSYQWISGRWRLFGISLSPRSIASVQPEAPRRRQ